MLNSKQIKGKKNSRKTSKRVGRGASSGMGKTCCRGNKGQKARSGVALNGFEGGQMPLFRRLPKRGFNSRKKKDFSIVNILRVAQLFENKKISGTKVTIEDMKKFSLATDKKKVKLIGNWVLDNKVSIETNYVSKKLAAAAEENGAKIIIK
jgi:large subunit ribosomal protein L15